MSSPRFLLFPQYFATGHPNEYFVSQYPNGYLAPGPGYHIERFSPVSPFEYFAPG